MGPVVGLVVGVSMGLLLALAIPYMIAGALLVAIVYECLTPAGC
jgi:small basic protein